MRKILGVILLLVLGIATYFISNLVTREYKIWEQSPQYEGGNLLGGDNHYDATTEILNKWTGQQPQKLKNWRDFKPKATDQNQLLFIFQQQLRTPAAQNKILDWVAQGNHLVSIVEEQHGPVNKIADQKKFKGLAERLDVKRVDIRHLPIRILAKNNQLKVHPLCIKESVQNENAWRAIGDPNRLPEKTYAKQTLQQLSDSRKTAHFPFSIDNLIRCTLRLNEVKLPEGESMFISTVGWEIEALAYFGKSTPIFIGNSPTGSDIIKIAHGKGTATFVSGNSLFKNPNIPTQWANTIRQFDHAWFLTYLSQGKSKILLLPKAKDFIEKNPQPSLLKVLLQKAPELSTAILLLGLLFIWQKAWRHGTILAPLSLVRSRLAEHFSAQGEFIRRYLGLTVLISQLQDDLWLRISKRIPNILALPPEQKLKELKRITALSSIDLMRLFEPAPTKLSPFNLVKYVISLQKIRNKL